MAIVLVFVPVVIAHMWKRYCRRYYYAPLEYDAIVGGDMVTYAKPDPEIFLVGAKILSVQPSECLVLEDC